MTNRDESYVPPACRRPAGAGSGPLDRGDVVDLVNAPTAPAAPGADLSGLANAVASWVQAHPDVTAGLYVSGDAVWVGFTMRAEAELAALRRDTGGVSNVRAFRATFTEAELRGLQDRVTADLADLKAQGVDVSGVGVDVYTNRLSIMLAHVDDRTCAVLVERYGNGRFYVEEGTVRALNG